MGPGPSLRARLLLAVVSTVLSAAAALYVWQRVRLPARPPHLHGIEVREGAETEGLLKHGMCVVDPIVGHRPRRSVVLHGSMGPLGGALVPVTRYQNNLSLIREDDLHEPLTGPRVLVHGDSHMMGYLDTADNAASVLERMLREEKGLEQALVLNAGCDNYNFYQYVLRTRALAAVTRPDLIIVIAYMGNDFVDLEDTRRPHIDDAGRERPTSPNPPPETTTTRLAELRLDEAGPKGGLFWQGLNQALYFVRHPDRVPVIQEKTRIAARLLKAEAERLDAKLLVVMLPSCALVFPDQAIAFVGDNDVARSVIESGTQQRFYDWFGAMLDEEGVDRVDLLPAYRRDGRLELYADDLHIWKPGHRRLAETLRAPVLGLLRHSK